VFREFKMENKLYLNSTLRPLEEGGGSANKLTVVTHTVRQQAREWMNIKRGERRLEEKLTCKKNGRTVGHIY